jgi:hypothetical protein
VKNLLNGGFGNLYLEDEILELRSVKRISDVPSDIDNQLRNDPTDFGADEY